MVKLRVIAENDGFHFIPFVETSRNEIFERKLETVRYTKYEDYCSEK